MKMLLLFITILAALVFAPAVIAGEYVDATMDIGQSQSGSNSQSSDQGSSS